MEIREVMKRVEDILDRAKTAVLATVDEQERPRARWMSPVVLPDEPRSLYAVTSPAFAKTAEMRKTPRVDWLVQTPDLREIVCLRGCANLIDNPSIRSRVMEKAAKRLGTFWRVSGEQTEWLVVETVIDHAEIFHPMKPEKITVHFGREA
jgi:general stress protein 26